MVAEWVAVLELNDDGAVMRLMSMGRLRSPCVSQKLDAIITTSSLTRFGRSTAVEALVV